MRKKRWRFQANIQQANLIEPGKPTYQALKGQWSAVYFGNQHTITLELGCGQGAYTVGLAKQFPQQNFIGIDIKGARLWVGSTYAVAQQLTNVAFLRTHIAQLAQFFAPGEVAELYLPFPDPQPKNRDAKKRLLSPRFLMLYRSLMKPGGIIHLKTDNDALLAYTLAILQDQKDVYDLAYTADLYANQGLTGPLNIQTHYEKAYLAQGIKIKYLRFALGISPGI